MKTKQSQHLSHQKQKGWAKVSPTHLDGSGTLKPSPLVSAIGVLLAALIVTVALCIIAGMLQNSASKSLQDTRLLVEREREERKLQIEKLAVNGNDKAQRWLGDCYSTGRRGMSKDDMRATAWYYEAAKRGNAEAKRLITTPLPW